MGIEPRDLEQIIEFRRQNPAGSSLGILGDCLFHFDNEFLSRVSGTSLEQAGAKERAGLMTFAKALNFDSADTLDVSGNPTIRLNLHKPVGRDLQQKFNWIIDAGTLYWCFDVPSVLRNVVSMLKDHGFVIHISSISGHFGRGYYSLQPAFFRDFYRSNGFEILYMGTRVKPGYLFAERQPIALTLKRLLSKLHLIDAHDLGWREVAPECTFLSRAERHRLDFGPRRSFPEPDMIPNNALIMCFAKKIQNKAFTDPVLHP